ncbi:MAG: hypothetical protein VXZ96_01960, partial [Myxococcota bacterium]|nr:hypothetical protein [Myxococcota bacterium]
LVQFEIENANVEVAFLSIMDPKIHQLVPRLSEEGVQITEPVQAAQNIVDALNSSPNPPKLIVILTTADAETQEAIRRKLKGAHLMIGDSTMATLRIEERLTDFVNMGAHNKAAPLTIPMDGLAEIEITFEIGHLKRLRNRPIHITSEMPTDSLITANITQNRLDHYDEESHFLLMPEGTGSLSQFDHTQWSQTVCEALRVHTGADTVFLRELPEITPIPGPIRQKDISDALSLMDTVEQHRIQGSKFARFLDQSVGITPVICGAQPGATYPVAKGRRIDADQMYVVVTTDLTRLGSTLDQTINAHVKNHTLDPPSQRTLSTPEGQPLSLREAVITELRNTNSRLGTENVYPYLSTISPVDKPPLWLFRSRGLSYRNERFQGMETDTFSAVPETLATSPSSSTLGYVADLALEYSDSNVIGDLRYQSRFTELTADEVNTEIEDDWKLSTSVTRPSWGMETGGILWMPYSELLYDSEYTPIEDDNGVSSPNRQSDLSVRAGLSTRPWKFIRNVRLAGLANRDIALLEDKPTEYAALAQFEMKVALRGGLIWSSNGEYLWYGKTQDDDLSDLRVRASGTSQISYPFSRLGSISVYGDALLIKGRLENTSEWGFAYTTGLSIDLIGAITLNQK